MTVEKEIKDAESGLGRTAKVLLSALKWRHIGAWDLDLIDHSANRTLEHDRIFGYESLLPEWTYEMFIGHVIPEDRSEVDRLFQTAIAERSDWRFECRIRRTDGAVRWIFAAGGHQLDSHGVARRMAGIVQDVTERKQAEEEERIAAVAFESHEAMMITDADTVVLKVNQAFTATTGFSSDDIVGQTPRILKSGRHDTQFYAAMWESINSSGSWTGEIWDRRKNGEVFPNWMTISAVKAIDGAVTHYVGSQADITFRKAAEDEIKHLAFFDALTGLPNRRLLMDRLRHALETSLRTRREGALMFIDLDDFKRVNDSLGHDKGDLLLQQVALRLSDCVRDGDTVARLGGDEFVVMLEELSENLEEAVSQVKLIGAKILASLNRPYELARQQHHSTSSIGVTLFAENKNHITELLKRSDMAMYQAKASGRNTLCFFDAKVPADGRRT